MKAVIQRVRQASVEVEGSPHAAIGPGLLILLGVGKEDGSEAVETLASKIAGLRVFEDDKGRMNFSIEAIGGEFLVVSQFTLQADLSRGKRPSFEPAMKPPGAERLYGEFCKRLGELSGRPVRTGRFGASMTVSLVNEGPATFVVETGGSKGV